MSNLEIMSLKPEYQRMVMNNQQKYNPDFDGVLNEDEIGVLMTESGVSSQNELLSQKEDEKFYNRDITTNYDKSSEFNETAKRGFMALFCGTVLGGIAYLAGWIGVNDLLSKVGEPFYKTVSHTHEYPLSCPRTGEYTVYDHIPTKLGKVVSHLGGAAVTGLLAYGLYKLVKHCKEKSTCC